MAWHREHRWEKVYQVNHTRTQQPCEESQLRTITSKMHTCSFIDKNVGKGFKVKPNTRSDYN
eukprot:4409324-Amphidinium_carterae.1